MKKSLHPIDELKKAPMSNYRDSSSLLRLVDENAKILKLGPVQTKRYFELIAICRSKWNRDVKRSGQAEEYLKRIHETKSWIPGFHIHN